MESSLLSNPFLFFLFFRFVLFLPLSLYFFFSFSLFFSCRWVFCVSRFLRLNSPENGPRSSLEGSFVQRGFREEMLAMPFVSVPRSGVFCVFLLEREERVVEISRVSIGCIRLENFESCEGLELGRGMQCSVSPGGILNFNMVEVISFHLKVSRFLLFIRFPSSITIRKSEYIPYGIGLKCWKE